MTPGREAIRAEAGPFTAATRDETTRLQLGLSVALAIALFATRAFGAESPTGTPAVTLDLGTSAGVAAMNATWRYSDTKISEVDFRSVGHDLKPTGAPNRTYDFAPHAGAGDFDDSAWETIEPGTLVARRSTGKLCFNWYRLNLAVPARVGDFATAGATLVFEATVDDYAEVWVDGVLARTLGQRGGGVVAGFNVPNRLVIARGVKPGQRIQLALFGINGPISASPENYIWIRSAKLDFYPDDAAPLALEGGTLDVLRKDAALDALLAADARFEKLADGFQFTEGPVWDATSGSLLFSDPNTNVIYRLDAARGASVFREHSGYDGADVGRLHQPGSNGIAFDPQGRLTACEHGNRRVTRTEPDGKVTVLADRFEGKRLNSPNDLVYRSDGTLYFTDPPFGLAKAYDDPAKEMAFSGVFCWKDGKLRLVSRDLKGPNGIAFSPDERWLYVSNWDDRSKIIMRYAVQPDGALRDGKVFFDMTSAPGAEALDGLKVDTKGNIYSSGPGGVWVISPIGKHLGTLRLPELPANFAWGDADRKALYLTARTGVYKVRMLVSGAGAAAMAAGTTR
jgi:gluconolactonase